MNSLSTILRPGHGPGRQKSHGRRPLGQYSNTPATKVTTVSPIRLPEPAPKKKGPRKPAGSSSTFGIRQQSVLTNVCIQHVFVSYLRDDDETWGSIIWIFANATDMSIRSSTAERNGSKCLVSYRESGIGSRLPKLARIL